MGTWTQEVRGDLDTIAGSVAGGGSTPASGQKTVTTAGTAVAVGGDIDAKEVIIMADPDNGGNVYIGDSAVDSTGAKLPPGGILPAGNVNLSEIYIDADIDGEGISYYYTT